MVLPSNQFAWQDSYSEYTDRRDKTFSNNLYLTYRQPFFTYNRAKLMTQELELDLENTALTYATQKLLMEETVTRAFYMVYQNDLSLLVAREELENQKKSLCLIYHGVPKGFRFWFWGQLYH